MPTQEFSFFIPIRMPLAVNIAILVDGAFFLKRYKRVYRGGKGHTPQEVAKALFTMCLKHVAEEEHLYRILYYDCEPLNKRVHNPISKKVIDFSKSDVAKFRHEFFDELRKKRKVALRLGYIKDNNGWIINAGKTKELLSGKIQISDLTEGDVTYEAKQKSVDMKIGLDIASLALKKSVNKIILISGDGDFVPAAKMARREGIDFVLDPMWNHIDDSLFEHIDGLKSTSPKPFIPAKKINIPPQSMA